MFCISPAPKNVYRPKSTVHGDYLFYYLMSIPSLQGIIGINFIRSWDIVIVIKRTGDALVIHGNPHILCVYNFM